MKGLTVENAPQVPPNKIRVQIATEKTFCHYGEVIPVSEVSPDYDIGVLSWPRVVREVYLGNEAGLRTTNFTVEWDQFLGTEPNDLILFRTNSKFKEAGCIYKADAYHVDKLHVRIDGSSLLCPLEDGKFYLFVAESQENGEPKLETIGAFSFPEDTSVLLKAGIWWAYPIPAEGTKKMAFQEKFSAVNARLELSLANEFKILVKIVR